jgi:hypothetical protein
MFIPFKNFVKNNQNLILAFCLCLALAPQSGWAVVPGDTNTLQGAIFLATNAYPNKIILLVVSDTNTCSACRALESTGFPSTNPPVYQMLRQSFVYWPCGPNENCTAYQQWLGTGTVPVPQILMLDPMNTQNIAETIEGFGGASGLLISLTFGLMDCTAPYVTSLVDASNTNNHLVDINLGNWQKTNTVASSNIIVLANSITTNELISKVNYKLDTTSTWTTMTLANKTAWAMPLNPAQIVSGVNVLRFYASDINFNSSRTNVFYFIYSTSASPASSVTTVTNPINPSVYGQAVTFTATVSGTGGTPTGTVTFKDGANTLGTGTLNGSGQATFTTNNLTVAGSPHSISAVYGGDSNFNGSTSSNALSQTITPASLGITASNDSKTYGQPRSYGPGSTAFTSSVLQNNETIGSVTITASGGAATNAAAGSYNLIPSAATGGTFTASNYTITYTNGTLTVTPAVLSITASNQSKLYGQTVPFGSGGTAFASSGLQNNETIGSVTLAVSGNGGAATAPVSGSPYTITPGTATGGSFTAGNYAITYNTGTLTVNPAALSITASNQSKIYGQTVPFGSGSTAFASSGLQNNETIGSVTLAVSGNGGATAAAVGNYTITPSAATGGTFIAGNYTITYYTGTLTVNPIPGDVNGDGKVDQIDLEIVLTNLGPSILVSQADVEELLKHYQPSITNAFALRTNNFEVEFSTNVTGNSWSNFGQFTLYGFVPTNAPQGFYRLIVLP